MLANLFTLFIKDFVFKIVPWPFCTVAVTLGKNGSFICTQSADPVYVPTYKPGQWTIPLLLLL